MNSCRFCVAFQKNLKPRDVSFHMSSAPSRPSAGGAAQSNALVRTSTTAPARPAAAAAAPTPAQQGPKLPHTDTFKKAATLALRFNDNRPPISLDYWESSIAKQSCIGINADQQREKQQHPERNVVVQKKLYMNKNEYTSHIQNVYYGVGSKADPENSEMIIMTENTIYLVAGSIPQRLVTFEPETDEY